MGRGVVKDLNNYWSGTQTFERIVVEEAIFLAGAGFDLSGGNVTLPSTLDSGAVQAKDNAGLKLQNDGGTEIFRVDDSGHIGLFGTANSSWGTDYRAVEGPNTTWLMSALPSGNEAHFVSHAYIDNVGWKYKTASEIPIKSTYGAGVFHISTANSGLVGDPLTWSDRLTVTTGGVGINNSNPSASLDARSLQTDLGICVAAANTDASKALFMYSGHDNQAPTLFWRGGLGMAFGTGYDYTSGASQSAPTNYLLNQTFHLQGSESGGLSNPNLTVICDGNAGTYYSINTNSTTLARGFSFIPNTGVGVHGRVIRAVSFLSMAGYPVGNFKLYGRTSDTSFTQNLTAPHWTLLVSGNSTSVDVNNPDVFGFSNNTVFKTYMVHFLDSGEHRIAEMGMFEEVGFTFTKRMEILPNGNVEVANTLNADTLQEGNVDLSTRYILANRLGTDVCELSNGVVPNNRIPPLAISETNVVATLAARNALTTQRGDIAIVTGTNQTFIKLNDDPATTNDADWTELVPNAVMSVNGDTGPIVSLDTSQIAENNNLYYTNTRVLGVISTSSINTFSDVSLSLATAPQNNSSSANKALKVNSAGNGIDQATFSLPTNNGSNGEVLTSNGTGGTAWADPSVTFLDVLDTPSLYTSDSTTDLSDPTVHTVLGTGGGQSNVIDNNSTTNWSGGSQYGQYVVVDFKAPVLIGGISIDAFHLSGNLYAYDFRIEGSTNGSTFTDIFPSDGSLHRLVNQAGPQVFRFSNNTPYQHIKVYFNNSYKNLAASGNNIGYVTIKELEFYETAADYDVKVNSTASGLVFEKASASSGATFAGLSDTPANFSSSEGKVVTVNSVPNALEFTSVYDVIRDTQTPDITSYNSTATISSHDHNVIFSNPSQDIALTLPISTTDASLNQESRFYIKNVSASHRVIVRGLSATDHPQSEKLSASDSTASSGSFVLYPKESAVFQGYNVSGNYRVVSHYRDDLTEFVTSSTNQTKSAKTFVATGSNAVTIDLLGHPFWPLNVPILFKNLGSQDLTLDPDVTASVDGSASNIVIPPSKSVAIQRVNANTLVIVDDSRVGSSGATDFVSLSDTPSSLSGNSNKFVKLNAASNALEFVTLNLAYLGAASAGYTSQHVNSSSNPHSVTAAQVGAATTGALSAHTNSSSNPHSVTAAQVGAATTGDLNTTNTNLTTHTGNTNNPHGTTFLKLGDTPAAYSNGNVVRSTTSGFEFFNSRQDDLSVITGAPSASQTLDCNINNGNQVFYFTSNPTSDVALTLNNLSLAQSHATTVVVVFNQGATPYKVTGVTITGQSSLTLKWQGGTNAGTSSSFDVFSFTILATAANTYTVFGNVTSFT